MCRVETFELSPRDRRLIASRVNGVLFGYVGRFVSRGTETSMSFIGGPETRILAQRLAVASTASIYAQKDKKQDEAQKKEIQSIVKVVDDVAAGQPAANELSLTW